MRRVAAVYAIHGPNGIYVGQSCDCWGRSTFQFALALGLDCGIVRELKGKSFGTRLRVEAEVAQMFVRRGFNVVSQHRGLAVSHFRRPSPLRRYLAECERRAVVPA